MLNKAYDIKNMILVNLTDLGVLRIDETLASEPDDLIHSKQLLEKRIWYIFPL